MFPFICFSTATTYHLDIIHLLECFPNFLGFFYLVSSNLPPNNIMWHHLIFSSSMLPWLFYWIVVVGRFQLLDSPLWAAQEFNFVERRWVGISYGMFSSPLLFFFSITSRNLPQILKTAGIVCLISLVKQNRFHTKFLEDPCSFAKIEFWLRA